MHPDDEKDILQASKIIKTIEKLRLRIHDRFPNSPLSAICVTLTQISKKTDAQISWIAKPLWGYRFVVGIFIFLAISGLVYAISNMEIDTETFTLIDLIEVADSVSNNLIMIGALIVFLVSIESRAKRRKVVECVNRLRSIAHLIDANQLTKDPNVKADGKGDTRHSPKREMTPYQLSRYLDYCSEMLSLVGKIGFLYVQKFHDPVAVKSVNDLEALTTGLSGKIWQKIMVLKTQNPS